MMTGTVASGLDFESWFTPLTLRDFARTVLGREPMVGTAREQFAARLRNTLGIQQIEDVFAKQVQQVYAWFHDLEGQLTSAIVPVDSAKRLYAAGTTLFVKRIGEFARFEREVAETFRVSGASAKVQLFCNRPSAVTKVHFDPVDVITVQLTGRKTWRIAPNAFAPAPMEGWGVGEPVFPNLRAYVQGAPPVKIPASATEYVLEPGSVLHVPRGYWHETFSDQDSISLHILLIPPLRADFVLASLKNELVRHARWRESMYDFETADEIAARLASERAAIHAALDLLDARDLRRAPVAQRPVDPGAVFVRAGQAGFGIDEVDDAGARISVTAYGFRETQTASVRVGLEVLPVLRWIGGLATGALLDVADVLREAPGLTKADAQGLLGLLEQARLVRRTG
jgi:50S ribosomal protein L16 3-hydroxylase